MADISACPLFVQSEKIKELKKTKKSLIGSGRWHTRFDLKDLYNDWCPEPVRTSVRLKPL